MRLEWSAIRRICQDLGLPAGDSYTQDWVYELPAKYRSKEFLTRYVAAYSNPEYGHGEKRVLMQLMLDVTNELLETDAVAGRNAWESVVTFLRERPGIHLDQVEYWAMPGRPLEEAFSVTPLVRTLL
ncbi:MAG TPA: hypothetical protein VFB81_10050 [Myxococcales bacterium]|nr:hypothetical protein [Myxococcales bacterium]